LFHNRFEIGRISRKTRNLSSAEKVLVLNVCTYEAEQFLEIIYISFEKKFYVRKIITENLTSSRQW
jgi:hypothetical protein